MDTQPLSLFIFNSIEDEWKFSRSIKSAYHLSDSYLYMNAASAANSILISPLVVPTKFKEYVSELVGCEMNSLSPHHKGHSICMNIIADKNLFSHLIQLAKEHGNTMILRAYVSTPELLKLRGAFMKKGVTVLLPENTQEQSLWTVDFFGSKAGFRSAFSPYMPKGSICYSVGEALKKAKEIHQRTGAVVIKTNKGNSGEGVIIIKNKKGSNIPEQLFSDGFWKNNPIVVEEFVDTTKEKHSPFPSIEGFITHEGKVLLPYYCNMIVTEAGEFYGIEMGKKVVREKVRKEMHAMTTHIGKVYAKLGYRGRFDVDYLYDGKRLYANESNTRTNGGTDTYFITRHLIGRTFFTSRSVLSNYIELKRKLSFNTIMQMIQPIQYDKKRKIGFILGSENALSHKGLSFILIGKDREQTQILLAKMHTLLKSILTIKKNEQ